MLFTLKSVPFVLDPNGNREGAQALRHAMKRAWYEAVVEALQAIHDYIALDKPFYANHFVDLIMRSTAHLIIHPEIARQQRQKIAGGKEKR